MNGILEEIIEEIRIDPEDEVKGFRILLKTNSSFICLPDNKYIVPENVLEELEKYDIKFKLKKDY